MIAAAFFVVAAATPPLTPCTLSHPSAPRVYGSCGAVDVAVDVAHPEGKKVAIAFAVLPPTSAEPRGLPIAFLAGGPGQAATRDYVPLLPMLGALRADHSIVLVDIRGTGRSEPQSCADERPLDARIKDDNDVDNAAACVSALSIDPKFITTRDAARDVDAVRVALGLDRWDVLGASYATRLAVVYDQLFPGNAHALVVDGVAPLDRALGEDVPADMTAALKAAGDDAVAAFVALKRKYKAQPTTMSARHPTTGKLIDLPVDDKLINGTVRMLVYADETRALLGPVLQRALAGDLQPLLALAITVTESLEGIHGPVNAAILCAEDVPYFTDEPPPVEAVFDDERPTMKKLCAKWPHATAPQPRMQPTSTPTLILSGEFDPVTPPSHARRIEAQFADHAHVVVTGGGHGALAKGCVPDVVVDFLAKGTAKDLGVSCVKKIRPFPSFVDLLGPAP